MLNWGDSSELLEVSEDESPEWQRANRISLPRTGTTDGTQPSVP